MNVILRVVDTETTGLDPAVDKIVEIACVDVVLGADGRPRRGASWSTLVNPGMVRSVLVSTVQPLAK
jgi:DNA polymerase III epsilon subunit-like protein